MFEGTLWLVGMPLRGTLLIVFSSCVTLAKCITTYTWIFYKQGLQSAGMNLLYTAHIFYKRELTVREGFGMLSVILYAEFTVFGKILKFERSRIKFQACI